MKTTEEVEHILNNPDVDRRTLMLNDLLSRNLSYEDMACLLVGVFDQLTPDATKFSDWCDHMQKSMEYTDQELAQLKVIGTVTYKNLTHHLLQEVEVTQKAFERLKEREAAGEIFIIDFAAKGGDAE